MPRPTPSSAAGSTAPRSSPSFSIDYADDLADPSASDTVSLTTDLLMPLSPLFILGSYMAASGAVTAAASVPDVDDTSDQAVNGDLARSLYDVSGAGVKVGILSDSFDVLGGAAADVAAGNLPAGVQVLEEGPAGSHDEGRAMAELVHQIAPDAQIVFHTATNGEADFAAGIAALVADGCQVIVDDVAYLDEPFFQESGPVDTAVQQAIGSGVSYFTAAGNQGNDYIQQDFVPLHLVLPGLPPGAAVQNFGSVATPQPWLDVTIPTGGDGVFDLQWDQPFAGSADSLGLALFDASGDLIATATADQVGGEPDQILTWTNTTQQTSFRLVLYANGGTTPPGLFKIISYGNGSIDSVDAGQGSGSVIGHEMVPGANTVGAMAWSASPVFGGSNAPESYSSVGTGMFLLGADGAMLSQAESTQKVDFLAPDGSMTSVLAPFYGTSAAAANAAGVAALVLQADPALTPAQVTAVLEQTAVPASGSPLATGAGLLDASAAVQAALALAHGGA